jgi:hypothetical protein
VTWTTTQENWSDVPGGTVAVNPPSGSGSTAVTVTVTVPAQTPTSGFTCSSISPFDYGGLVEFSFSDAPGMGGMTTTSVDYTYNLVL